MKRKICFLFVLFALTGLTINAQNYDESKVGSYQLPELLETLEGIRVKTVESWEQTRRPEILKLFEDHVYGKVPRDFDAISFEITREDRQAMNGKATLKVVAITVSRDGKPATMNLLMFTPNEVKGPVPAFLVINHRGVKTMDITRQNKDGFWPAELVIDAGYAISGFDVVDVAPDDKEKFDEGILKQLYPEQLEMDNGMRALGAWGWGASRAIDYFEKEPSVNAEKIIVVGHSRGGKAALWCGAQDQRVAVTISNESGNSGAALSRRNFGETVGRIVRVFPHWFCENYGQYSGKEDQLPVDQHMLIALMAPRAVYVGVASEDLWADPLGQYLALKESTPVWEIYGFSPDFPGPLPAPGQQIIRNPLGFHNREGKHNMTPWDWEHFIRFVNHYWNKNQE